jgi:nucleoside-diphosphate-sugar epimerase
VTGGAGAIGGAIVSRLSADHTVVVFDRTGDIVVDLVDQDDVRRAAVLVSIATAVATSSSIRRRWSPSGRSTG